MIRFEFTHTQDENEKANEMAYVQLGLQCVDTCRVLYRGMGGKELGDLNPSVRDAINQLTV